MTLYQPTELWQSDEIDVPSYGVIRKKPYLDLAGFAASWLRSKNYIVPYQKILPDLKEGQVNEPLTIITSTTGTTDAAKKIRTNKNVGEPDPSFGTS